MDKTNEEAWQKPKKANSQVYIDFTGYTCTNCRAMETNIYSLESIQKRFAKMQ